MMMLKPRVDIYVCEPIFEYIYPFIVGSVGKDWIGSVCVNSGKGRSARTQAYLIFNLV